MENPRRREPRVAEARVALDEKGRALSALLPEVFSALDVEVGAALDEVVVAVGPTELLAVCRTAREEPRLAFDYLRCLSAVDYVDRIEVVYHLFSLERRHKMVVKVSLAPDSPRVPSVVSIWKGADWFEREAHDLFGVEFEGHPNLAPLLLYEGFEGHPGLKSFPFHEYDEW